MLMFRNKISQFYKTLVWEEIFFKTQMLKLKIRSYLFTEQ